MDKIKNLISAQYNWYLENLYKIIFVVGLHFLLSFIVQLPYFNILTSFFSFIPYFFDWIAILILFKPQKELILKVGLSLFVVSFFFALIKLNFVLEVLGEVSFLMIGTYVILSLREMRK